MDKKSFLRDLVDKCIKEFLDKILAPKPVVSTVPKKDLVIALLCLGTLSLQIHARINRIMKTKLPYCYIQFVFQTKWLFTFKDKIPSFLCSAIVYKFQCGDCNAIYYGKTKRYFKVRMCKHLGISAFTTARKTKFAQSWNFMENSKRPSKYHFFIISYFPSPKSSKQKLSSNY